MMRKIRKFAESIKSSLTAAQSFKTDLSILRAQIDGLRNQLSDLDAVAPSSDEITANVSAFFNGLRASAAAKTQWRLLSSPAGGVRRLTSAANGEYIASVVNGAVQGSTQGGLSPLETIVLARPEIEKEALAEALATVKGERQMSRGEIRAERARLEAEIDDLEKQEETGIRQAEQAGMPIRRRATASAKWALAPDSEFTFNF